MTMKTVRLYGAGGAGINVVSSFMKDFEDTDLVRVMPAIYDTSESNRSRYEGIIDDNSVFVLKKAQEDTSEGSGKHRLENGEAILSSIPGFLLDQRPGDFNIVCFSGVGGSGSVAGPEILTELISRGEVAVGIMIEDRNDMKEVTNCIKTIESLFNGVDETGVDICVSYHKNIDGETLVNKSINDTIAMLLVLFSGKVDTMDVTDVKHLLMPSKVAENEMAPALCSIQIAFNADSIGMITNPVAAAAVYVNPEMERTRLPVEYSTHGFFDFGVEDITQVFYTIGTDDLDKNLNDLTTYYKEVEEKSRARKSAERSRDARMKSAVGGKRAGRSVL